MPVFKEEGNTPMTENPHSPPWSPAPPEPRWLHGMNDSHVYHDPKWDDKDYMASVAMADVEFEMDMYDYFTKTDNQLALQGLKEHSQYGGPLRYMDMRPLNHEFYLGAFEHGDEGRGPRRIDINLKNLIDMNEKSRIRMRGRVPHEIDESGEWALRNAIFDLYGHEYGHGIKRLNEFRDLDLEHPAIYYNTAQKGVHPGMKRDSKYRYETWDREYPDIPPGPWSDFQSSDYSRYDFDYLNRDMSDIAEDIIAETTMYHGRSPLDENLTRLPWQSNPPPEEDYDMPGWNEFNPGL